MMEWPPMDWNTDLRKRAVEIAFEIARADGDMRVARILKSASEIDYYLRTGFPLTKSEDATPVQDSLFTDKVTN